jgi:hypothetical protein
VWAWLGKFEALARRFVKILMLFTHVLSSTALLSVCVNVWVVGVYMCARAGGGSDSACIPNHRWPVKVKTRVR